MDILQSHIDQLAERPMRGSELLFPNEEGGFRSTGVLLKPFTAVGDALELDKHITPRAMRRTFQDLARASETKDVVTRSISGHATEEMQQHYSTVQPTEMRNALAQVISLGGFREALAAGERAAANDAPAIGGGQSGGQPLEPSETG